ncbi:M23 family metallopeptidase [Shinella daejeonensis]|uniref:M23 family metallopeptidase n=1 Tax=Shinella daejeonensis TaxID=659017 RepID=UPI0020C79F29|nr:M23 family metallopeptidase [Shinella daejeonensis]MCP8893806.1 M23 family metallopeptidase [Shinella daejeonensis]
MATSILILLSTQLLLPLFFILWPWLPRPADRLGWLVRILYGACYLTFLSLVARWDWIAVPLGTVFPLAFLVGGVLSWLRVMRRPWNVSRSILRAHGFTLAMAIFFLALAARTLSGYGYGPRAVVLTFPLSGGTYFVAQGGGNASINHHAANAVQRYALDIVALDRFGRRANGLTPPDLTDYAIFERQVVSPCNGVAIAVHDGRPDNPIGRTDARMPAGNHVVLACGNVRVMLAHLERGSILIDGGAVVQDGQPIGRVGNSGNTTEPHLHIHAYEGGTFDSEAGHGVPILFDGRFLVRGSVVTVP